jgi:hypothetical protein
MRRQRLVHPNDVQSRFETLTSGPFESASVWQASDGEASPLHARRAHHSVPGSIGVKQAIVPDRGGKPMKTLAGPWRSALLVLPLALACPGAARADRVDIADPTLLGDVVRYIDLGEPEYESSLVSEVRFRRDAAGVGVYSYVYAVQSGRYFPAGESDPRLLSYGVTEFPSFSPASRHGAILSTDTFWRGEFVPNPTATIRDVTALDDGFLVIPGPSFEGQFIVLYVESRNAPVARGLLTYTARNFEVDYETGERIYVTDSFRRDGMLVPTPEPGSIVLFGSGLAALVIRHRRRRGAGARPH